LHINDRAHPTIPPTQLHVLTIRTKHGRSIQNRPEYASRIKNTHFPPQILLNFMHTHFAPVMLKSYASGEGGNV